MLFDLDGPQALDSFAGLARWMSIRAWFDFRDAQSEEIARKKRECLQRLVGIGDFWKESVLCGSLCVVVALEGSNSTFNY